MTTPPVERPAAQRPGRPPGPLGRGRRVNVYLPAGLHDEVREAAHDRGTSLSGAIVEALRAWLGDTR